jgi:hypothetical protein
MRNALTATLAPAVAPGGFTVADFTAKVRAMTGQGEADYTIRQAAYDLRKLRAKHLAVPMARSRRYEGRPHAWGPLVLSADGILPTRRQGRGDRKSGPVL